MPMTPDQQQNLPLLHDGPGRHTLPRPAQHHRSWEHLMQTSRAVHTAGSSPPSLLLCRFELGCICVELEPRLF